MWPLQSPVDAEVPLRDATFSAIMEDDAATKCANAPSPLPLPARSSASRSGHPSPRSGAPMNRPVHFEIHAHDPQRAIAFYQEVFGWTFTPWGPPGTYWLVTTGPDSEPGINGGLVPRQGPAPIDGQAVNAFMCTVAVENVDVTHEAMLARGGVTALPKMAIPGVGWLGYCKDCEGNIVGLMQNDPNAR